MEIIESIPVRLSPEEIGRRLRLSPDRGHSLSQDELAGIAGPLIRLRAAYDVSYVGAKDTDAVEVAGVVFRSRVLRHNLDKAQKVFPFIMTVGPDLEGAAVASGDLLKQYYLEEIANMALETGASWLMENLRDRWGLPGISSMSPGSLEDWPITEQPKLFSLFGDTEKIIGVRLTESLLMIPRKSISGILFPSEENFASCELCPRENCPSRKAPYSEKSAADYGKREFSRE